METVRGRAMGTSYLVEADCAEGAPGVGIVSVLAEVNRQMSTYDDGSELSAFNRAPVGAAMPVSAELAEVAVLAQQVAARTGGAFDATVAPLVALWGFGVDAAPQPPTAAELQTARAVVGYRRFDARLAPPTLRKLAPVTLDFSALAKGYAVDRIARLLELSGCRSYLVELGGEVRVHGANAGGQPWRIGIESPFGSRLALQLSLREGAVATSGDYRQYRPLESETGRVRATHILDPRSGAPVNHRLASATVVAETAALADAYATALMVLGEEAGLAFAERHDLAALFIRRTDTGHAIDQTSAMMPYRQRRLP